MQQFYNYLFSSKKPLTQEDEQSSDEQNTLSQQHTEQEQYQDPENFIKINQYEPKQVPNPIQEGTQTTLPQPFSVPNPIQEGTQTTIPQPFSVLNPIQEGTQTTIPQPFSVLNPIQEDTHATIPELISAPCQNVVLKDNFELFLGKDYTDKLPLCAEKYLKELIILLQKTSKFDENTIQTILLFLSKLKHHLTQESQLRQDIEKALQESENYCKLEDAEELLKYLKIIKGKIMSLDVSLMKAMFEKGEEAAKRIQGKDICLLLGVTGAGKSTTIHFLAGSQMIETKVDGISHIGPSVVHPQAKEIMTGPHGFSATKFINCVNVGNLIICDSPGFEDSQGPEVDIANGFGVVKGIKGCKTLIPVIVVSFPSLGERFKGLKNLARLVSSMFTNLENHIGTFRYIFTKFPKKQQEQVSVFIKSIIKSLNEMDKLDLQFVLLLNDIQQKAKWNQILFINPLNDDREDILRQLQNSGKTIKKPYAAIKQYMSQQSADALKNQCSLHKDQIIKFVEKQKDRTVGRSDNEFIEFLSHKLDELRFLNVNLDNSYIIDAYNDSILFVSNFFTEQSNQLQSALEKSFDLNNFFNEADLKQFKQGLLTFKVYDILKNKYLKPETGGTVQLIQFLKNKVNNLIQQSQNLSYSDKKMHIILDKLKPTSSEFIQFESENKDIIRIVSAYNDVIQYVIASMQNDLQSIEQLYQKFDFEKTAQTFFSLKKCQKYLKNHLNDSLDNNLKQLQENFQIFLVSYANEISCLLKIDNEDDKYDNLIQIAKIINNIESFLINFQAEKHEDILKIITTILQGSYDQVLDFINKTAQKIQVIEYDDCYFNNIKKLVIKIKNLRDHISIVRDQSAEIFYQVVERIFSQVDQAIKETKEILDVLQIDSLLQDGNTKFTEIIDNLQFKLKILLSSQWLNQLKNEYSTQKCDEFFKQIQKCCKQLESQVKRIQITIKENDQLNLICTIINNTQGLKIFDEINSNAQLHVTSIADSIQSKFNGQIQEVSDQIQQVIVQLQKVNKMEEENKLENSIINNIEESYIFIEEFEKLKNQQEFVPLKIELLIDKKDPLKYMIQNHHNQSLKYIKDTFGRITSYNGAKREELLKDSSDLENLLINLKKVQEQTVHFNKYLNTETIFEITDKLFSSQAEELKNQLENKVINKKPIEIELEIVRQLRRVDKYNQGFEKYYDIYKEFSSKNIQILEISQGDLQKKIREHDFSSIEIDLIELKQRKSQETLLNRVCQTITKEIIQLIEDTKNAAMQTEFKDGMTKPKLGEIIKSVKKIDECQQLESFLTYKSFKEDIQEIINKVSKNYMIRLDQIEQQIKQNNFFQANQELQDINFVGSYLEKYCPSYIMEKIEKINIIKQQSLKQIFDYYNNIEDITELKVKAPKATLEKLHKANLESERDQLIEIITEKFSLRIREIQKEGTKKSEMLLNSLKIKLPSLGDQLENQIKALIDDALGEIEKEKGLRITHIEDNKENPTQLFSLLKESMTNNHQHDEVKKIKDQLKEILEKYCKVINYKINTLDQEVIMALEEIAQIKKNLEDLNLCTQFPKILDTERKFKGLFNEAIQQTHDLLKSEEIDDQSDQFNNRLTLQLSMQSDDDFMSSTPNQNTVNPNHLIKIISIRISTENVTLAFIPNFEMKLFKEIEIFIQLIIKNQNIITENLKKEYPNLQEIKSNIQWIKRNNNFFKQLKEQVLRLLSKDQKQLKDNLNAILLHAEILDKIKIKLNPFTNEIEGLCQQLISDSTRYEAERQDFYKKFNAKLLFINDVTIVFKELKIENNYNAIIKECQNNIIKIINQMHINAINLIRQKEFKSEELSIQYYYLIDINEFISEQFKPPVKPLIDEIKEKIELQMNFSFENGTKSQETNKIVQNIIELKFISQIHFQFKNEANLKIDMIMENVMKRKDKDKLFSNIQDELLKNQGEIGKQVTEEHYIFKSIVVKIFNQKTSSQGIDYVMKNLRGTKDDIDGVSNIDEEELKEHYNIFNQEYESFVKKYIHKNIQDGLDEYKSVIRANYYLKENKNDLKEWKGTFKEEIPTIMAYIFAMYTLMKSDYYQQAPNSKDEESKDSDNQESANDSLFRPHPAQIIGIFRILGLGNNVKTGFVNNLVQIGTGEGKSVTIAVTAIILALLGFDVSCACYSEYLSKRDQANFQNLFVFLEVDQFITYGTFDQLCENVINNRVNIRQVISNLFVNNSAINEIQNKQNKPQALVIDEVDVFFSQNYYGMQYCPVVSIRDDTINQLLKFIWQSRKNQDYKLTLNKIKLTPEYANVQQKFSHWESIINEQVLEILDAVKNLEGPLDYHLDESKGKIGYYDNDKISYEITKGYKTIFSYFAELDNKRIKQEHLDANLSLNLNCGSFSYAEIPKFFDIIMGATGTLSTLCQDQRKIVKDDYQILQFTFMPSVYGMNQLKFDARNDVYISKKDDYFLNICQQAEIQLKVKRPVLIFFEDAQKLKEFYTSQQFSNLKQNFKPEYLTEVASSEEKYRVINKATTSGSLSLFTKSYGRGTDFITRDSNVQAAGGSFIIQTFFSNEISEETQIKGRTARQGEVGSYIMSLLQDDLEKFNVSDEQIKLKGKEMYDFIDKDRAQKFSNFFKNHINFAQIAQQLHEDSLEFQKTILKRDLQGITEFILKNNKGKVEDTQSRIVILMDATGSMGSLILGTKQTVFQMLVRTQEILIENNLPTDCFSVQFAAYRNYSSSEANLLQVSEWTTKPQQLQQFLHGVSPSGGMGNEAIEVGLWHALKEHETEHISSIILIGDAPPNTEDVWKEYINQISTKFSTVRNFEQELDSIIEEEIPVNAFYVHNRAKQSFENISNQTNGRSSYLDIDSKNGAEDLTKLVTEQILEGIERSKGMQGQLVSQYVKKYISAS